MNKVSEEQLGLARQAILHFGNLSYDRATWERLLTNPSFQPHGCLLDILGVNVSDGSREQIALDIASDLRIRFPEFTRGAAAWKRKDWSNNVVDHVLLAILESIERAIARPRLAVKTLELAYEPSEFPQTSGWMPWRLFRNRFPVSRRPGLYILAYSDGAPEQTVDPLSDKVIYIGIAEDQSTGTRLSQFENSALGKTGHSAGWTFRLELLQKYYDNNAELLRGFHNLYCSWLEVTDGKPRDIERQLIHDYRSKWGARPFLNRQD